MNFAFTDEQEQFRSVVRRFLTAKSPTTEVRRLMASERGFDEFVWQSMASELALQGIHLPEAYGGAGFGTVELAIAMEEQGRALLCSPFFSACVLAAEAIRLGGSEEQKSTWLAAIAGGQQRPTLALTEPDGRWDLSSVSTLASRQGSNYYIDGVKKFVIDGMTASQFVVVARTAGNDRDVSLFLVDGAAAGLTRTALNTMDATRKQATVEFKRTPAELLGEAGRGADIIPRLLDHACIALANEMIGGAQRLLESAVEYAKLRVQFGRAIGSFQAIKHKCADMLLEVELAKSCAYYAAQAEADGDSETPALACMAKAAAADAYTHAAAATIQIHGGIGFTWDHDTHLWFKRAKSSEVLFGDPSYHRELMLQRTEV